MVGGGSWVSDTGAVDSIVRDVGCSSIASSSELENEIGGLAGADLRRGGTVEVVALAFEEGCGGLKAGGLRFAGTTDFAGGMLLKMWIERSYSKLCRRRP